MAFGVERSPIASYAFIAIPFWLTFPIFKSQRFYRSYIISSSTFAEIRQTMKLLIILVLLFPVTLSFGPAFQLTNHHDRKHSMDADVKYVILKIRISGQTRLSFVFSEQWKWFLLGFGILWVFLTTNTTSQTFWWTWWQEPGPFATNDQNQ